MEHDILHFEAWHQRFGHISESKLRQTQKHVDGIAPFQSRALPVRLVHCRACDLAHLTKAPRGKLVIHTIPLKPGQMFHMDFGFIRGPSNLCAVVAHRADPAPKIIASRQGYVCYLLIIDAATRYAWVFPSKSKAAPTQLLDAFLRAFGRHDSTVRTIRSDQDGALYRNDALRAMVLDKHGYVFEPTGADASSQNGMVERPNLTFGNIVRCLLYSAGLPTEFWADALVHAVMVYNYMYHSRLKNVPYAAWTGRRPDVSHLCAFGAYVTVKKPSDRPTKLDPHAYDGLFLRHASTTKNIVYWDPTTSREKTARHVTTDEFHFGSANRPPGATQVIQAACPTLPAGGAKPPAPPILVVPLDLPPPIPPEYGGPILDTSLPTHRLAAAAATAYMELSPEEQRIESILALAMDENPYEPAIPVTLSLKNLLPTLGLKFKEDPVTGLLFLWNIQEGAPACRIPRWKSQLRHAVLRAVDGEPPGTLQNLVSILTKARAAGHETTIFSFAQIETKATVTAGIPQLHLDQLRQINRLMQQVRTDHPAPLPDAAVISMTRRKLKLQDDFHLWKAAEWNQLDKYFDQNMFGDPIPRPYGANVLPWV